MSLIHTCYRILDIDRSVDFYKALGFDEIRRVPIRDEAINVFMNLPEDGDNPRLELTHNFDQTEPYDIGTGYGHIAITTADLDGTLGQLAEQGIEPEKPPYTIREGGNRLCFVRDPDGYRIELIERGAEPGRGRHGDDGQAAGALRSGRGRPRSGEPRPQQLGHRDGPLRHRAPRSGGG